MRENLNPNYKFGNSDVVQLTEIATNQSLMMITSDSQGNFDWRGLVRAPLDRNAMQTTTGSNKYSDLADPWMSIPDEDWSGGRANKWLTDDTSRFYDSKRAQTAFKGIFNAPLDYYSKGFRKAETNCPGSVVWKQVVGAQSYIAVAVQPADSFDAGEIYIHLRRRGTPASPLNVMLATGLSDDSPIASHDYTTSEITDTVSEFAKFTFDPETLSTGTYYIIVSSSNGDSEDHWEVGTSPVSQLSTYISADGEDYAAATFELYYRIAEAQTDERTKFFYYEQLEFMVRQDPLADPDSDYAPSLWLNGEIGQCTSSDENTLTDSGKSWTINQWEGARIGLVYREGAEAFRPVWKRITANSTDTITIEGKWDKLPSDTEGTNYIIVDTPLWQEISGHGLTSYITDIHVIRGSVFFCQGNEAPIVKMRWNGSELEWMELTDVYADYLQSVRDQKCLMLWRGRNNDENHKRSVERSVLLDWETPWPAFDETVDYIIGQCVTYTADDETKSYVFKADHAAGAWSSSDVNELAVSDDADPNGKPIANVTSAATTSGGLVYTPSVDFGTGDFDQRLYVIDIETFSSSKNAGKVVITLQQSEDNLAFADVQSVTADSTGRWYINAHCNYRYRRLSISPSGSDCSVNNIKVSTTNFPHWEDRITLIDNYGKISKLFEYGAESAKSLWIFQEGMVSSVNFYENTYTLDRINIDELVTTSDEWNASTVATSDVYLPFAWLNGLQRYYNSQLEGKGPDKDEGLPSDRRGRITKILPYPANFFAAVNAGANGYSSVLMFNQNGWHEIYRAPNKGEQIFDMEFQPIYGDRPDRLWIQVGADVIWLAMPSKTLNALQDPNAEYTHESVVISSWFTGGMMDIQKQWQTMKIMADDLVENHQYVEADYQLDDETEWHPIDNYYIESPSQKEEINPSGSVEGKKFRYRLRIMTDDYTKTPHINVVVVEAVGRVDIKYSYAFTARNIKWKPDLNGEYEEIEPFEVQCIIDDWADRLAKLRLNCRYKIFDNKIVYLDASQTSVFNELQEGYLASITVNEL